MAQQQIHDRNGATMNSGDRVSVQGNIVRTLSESGEYNTIFQPDAPQGQTVTPVLLPNLCFTKLTSQGQGQQQAQTAGAGS